MARPTPLRPRPLASATTLGDDRPSVLALACAGTVALLWVLLDPRTADLAAQVYRSQLFGREGFALWDNAWFAGHHLPGYSLLFPPLGAALGPRTVGIASVLASSVLFAHLARRHFDHGRALAVAWFAVVAAGDLFIGRLTFALGVTFALACVVALSHRSYPAAVGLGVATAAASPVTALLLVVVLPAGLRSIAPRWRLVVLGAPLVVPVATALLFPEGGSQPYGLRPAVTAIAIALAVRALVAVEQRALRTGALLYALAVAGAFLVPSPMGSNVARLGVLLAGPVLILGARPGRSRILTAATCLAIAGWQLWAPLTESLKADASPATRAAYFQPLLDELERTPHGRVEIVPTSTRWESVFVAPHVALARGWQTQLDARYNGLFYREQLDPAEYERWLRRLGITHVALSDAPKERWGKAEERLLRDPPPYLREVWSSPHWTLFALIDPRPLASGGRLVELQGDGFTVATSRAGTVLVRVRWTPFWTGPPGACVRRSARGFTVLSAPSAGTWEVEAEWSVGAALRRSAQECA